MGIFCKKKGIQVYQIVRVLDRERQVYFISKLEDMGLTLEEKRKILVMLRQETKEYIDTNNLPPEYVSAIEMQTYDSGKKHMVKLKLILIKT